LRSELTAGCGVKGEGSGRKLKDARGLADGGATDMREPRGSGGSERHCAFANSAGVRTSPLRRLCGLVVIAIVAGDGIPSSIELQLGHAPENDGREEISLGGGRCGGLEWRFDVRDGFQPGCRLYCG
jgi:hypothetical protein